MQPGYAMLFLALITATSSYVVRLLFLSGANIYEQDEKVRALHVPPSIPNPVWFIIQFLRNPWRFFLSSRLLNGPFPIRLRLYVQDVFHIQGPANVSALLRNKGLSAFFLHGRLLYSCFGLSREGLSAYTRDDSGPCVTPHPGTHVKPHNRLEYRTFVQHHHFLSGSGFGPLFKRYEQSFIDRLASFQTNVRDGQTHGDDLMHLFRHLLTGPAVIDSIVGPALLERNPDFLNSFWNIHDRLWTFATRMPGWLVSKPTAAYEQCRASIRSWQAWATAHSETSSDHSQSSEDDPFWGSRFMRERQLLRKTVDGLSDEDMVSHDLAFLWAATHNTIASTFWVVLDVFNNAESLHRIREEVEACRIEQSGDDLPQFDLSRLLRQPYIQAAYAETLRLRTHGFVVRRPRDSLRLNEWLIPRKSIVTACSTTAHMNPTVWSTHERGSHPPDQYSPDRFIIHKANDTEPHFSMVGLDGSWMPFGGGVRACPGRHLVKKQTISTLATLVTMFDINITANDKALQMSAKRFGLGVLEPKGKISYEIRGRT